MGRLYAKLAEIMAAVEDVPQRGENKQQGYKYARDEDLVRAVRLLLAEKTIVLMPSVQQVTTDRSTGKQTIIRVEGTWTFIDGETGERHEVPMVGEGADFGDKGIYKAYTGALKYVIRQSFLIPTGDDPEKDGPPAQANGHATVADAPRKITREHAQRLLELVTASGLKGPAVEMKLRSFAAKGLSDLNAEQALEVSAWATSALVASREAMKAGDDG